MSPEGWIALVIGSLGIVGTVLGSMLWLGRRMGRIEVAITTIYSVSLPELKSNQTKLTRKVDQLALLGATAKVERETAIEATKNHETRLRQLETSEGMSARCDAALNSLQRRVEDLENKS